MVLNPGLGSLSVLPREIRDDIWAYLLPERGMEDTQASIPLQTCQISAPQLERSPEPGQIMTSIPGAMKGAGRIEANSEASAPVFSDILCTSRRMHSELTYILYCTRSLVFCVYPNSEDGPRISLRSYRQGHTPDSPDHELGVGSYDEIRLPILPVQRARDMEEQKAHLRTSRALRRLPYRLLQSVQIKLYPMGTGVDVVLARRSVSCIASLLVRAHGLPKRCDFPQVQFHGAGGCWDAQTKHIQSTRKLKIGEVDFNARGGRLMVVFLGLRRLLEFVPVVVSSDPENLPSFRKLLKGRHLLREFPFLRTSNEGRYGSASDTKYGGNGLSSSKATSFKIVRHPGPCTTNRLDNMWKSHSLFLDYALDTIYDDAASRLRYDRFLYCDTYYSTFFKGLRMCPKNRRRELDIADDMREDRMSCFARRPNVQSSENEMVPWSLPHCRWCDTADWGQSGDPDYCLQCGGIFPF